MSTTMDLRTTTTTTTATGSRRIRWSYHVAS
nr:MAG TPA: Glutaminase [Caudoviricetes sp.]DAO08702.1 MAG TPA: Glutaminase [Caudoviricetes sp.]